MHCFYWLALIAFAFVLISGGPKWLARLDFLSLVALIFYFAMGRCGQKAFKFNLLGTEKAKVALGALVGVLFISTFAHLCKHWGLETDGHDVGFVNQPLFYPFESTPMWCALCLNKSYLADHLVLSFYLIAPFTTLVKSDEFIIFIQYLVTLIPLIALFKYGPLKKRKELWLFAALLILAHRSLLNGLVFDFREDSLAFMGFLLSCVAFYNRKIFLAFVSLFVAMLSKENMALVSFFVTGPILLDHDLKYTKKERYIYAALIALVSVSWFGLTFTHIMPYFREGAQTDSVILMRLPGLGSTPLEIILNSFKNPLPLINFIFESVFTFDRIKYVIVMLFPFAFFSWRAWPWLIPVIPGLGMNLISAVENQHFMIFHYDYNILPFLFFSGIYGISKIPTMQMERIAWPVLLLALTFAGRSPVQHVVNHFPKMLDNYKHERFLNDIQTDEVVGMSMRTVGQLSHIKNLRVLNFPATPPLGDDTDLMTFESINRGIIMRSGLALDDVTHVVLDTKNEWEKRLAELFLNRGEIVATDDRFLFLKIKGYNVEN